MNANNNNSLTWENTHLIAKTLSERFPNANLAELGADNEKLLGLMKDAGLIGKLPEIEPEKMSVAFVSILVDWATEFYPEHKKATDLDALHKAAAAGDKKAMWDLAKNYEFGMNGVEKDIGKAKYYFGQAFEHGDVNAEVYMKLMDEENGDPEGKPLTWDNKRLIARRLQEYMPRTDAMLLDNEYVLQIMRDAGLPKELTENVPENTEHALLGVRYAWAKHSQYETDQ